MAGTRIRRGLVALGVVAAFLAPSVAGSLVGAGVARAADPALPDPPIADPAAAHPPTEPRPRLVWHGPRTDRVVALTFDDGWSAATLRRIFGTLLREDVPATFFVTGIYVQRAPDLWRRIAAAGYPLANHSYLHRDTVELTPRQVAIDLAHTRQVVEQATGRPMVPLFRPPYGSRSAATDRLAAAAGFPYVVMWDVTAGDTAPWPTVAGVVRDATAGRRGSIVLLHAGPRVTADALPAIIASYRERGFTFVTVPELLGLPTDVAVAPGPGTGAGQQPATSAAVAPSRSLDVVGGDDPPAATAGSGDVGEARRPQASPVAPAAPGALAEPVATPGPRPPARDAAWARGDGAPATLAGATAALLAVVLLVAAVAGRGHRAGDDDPA